VNTAIAIGQGAGLAVACGLLALLPLAVGARAATAGFLKGAVGAYDDRPVLYACLAAAAGGIALAAVMPARARLLAAAVAGGVVFELSAGERLPWAGLALGAVFGAGAAFACGRLIDGALRGGGTPAGVTAIAAGVAAVAGALAIVPFVGYALVAAAGWLGLRTRRAAARKYAGLRVLR
jgi:hypothetical protein